MLYDNYVNKIKKYAKVRDGILRYKILIITVFSVMMAALIAFLSTKGMFTSDLAITQEFVYGQELDPNMDAFASGTWYQFSADGKTWTEELPTLPGTYQVRAAAKRSFGIVSYSEMQEFEIKPKEVSVNIISKTIEFGSIPNISANLESGDSFAEYKVKYDNLALTTSDATVIKDSIVVKNSEGEDVTSGYSFTCNTSSIKFDSYVVTFTTESDEKVYDGTPLVKDAYTTSVFPEGNSVASAKVNGSIVNVGTVENTIEDGSIQIENAEGINTTANYKFNFEYGSLTITKRPITIKTNDNTFTYCNENYNEEGNKIIEGSLVEGHKLEVVESTLVKLVGTYENKVEYKILDEKNNDVTDNYEITYEYGSLTVDQRLVVLSSVYTEYEYDALVHSNTNWELLADTTIAPDDYVVAETSISVTDVDDTQANILSFKIYNGEDDVTENYIITTPTTDETYSWKNIAIIPRDVSINLVQKHEYIYDGLEHSFAADEWTYIENTLAGDHVFEFKSKTATNAGTYSALDVVSYDVYSNGELVNKNNYNLVFSPSKFTIKKRPITITPTAISKTYDATELVWSYDDYFTINNIVDGHIISNQAVVNGSRTNVDDTDTLVIDRDTIKIMLDSTDVTANYAITYKTSTITINARPITVTPSSITQVYDSTELSWTYDDYFVIDNIVDTHIIDNTVEVNGSRINTFDTDELVTDEDSVVILAGTEDVTRNYDITYVNGSIEITQRPITITPNDITKEYDSTKLSWTYADYFTIDDIIDTEYVTDTVEVNGSRIHTFDTDVTEIDIDSLVIMRDTLETTANYEITLKTGNIEITEKTVNITSDTTTYIYNGAYQLFEDYIIDSETPIISTDNVVVITTTKVKNIVTDEPNIQTYNIYNSDDLDVTLDYIILTPEDGEGTWGTISITQRDITITPTTIGRIYNAEPFTWSDVYNTTEDNIMQGFDFGVDVDAQKGIVSGHVISNSVEVIGSKTNVNDTDNTVITLSTVKILDDELNDVTENYNISLESGEIYIIKRDITINPKKVSFEYDGQSHNWLWSDGFDIETGTDIGLVKGHLIKEASDIVSGARIHTFDTALSEIDKDKVVILSGTDDVTDNYNIITVDGEIEITQRPITITPKKVTKIYDGTGLSWNKTNGYEFKDKDIVSGDEVIDCDSTGTRINVDDTDETVISNVKLSNGIIDVTEDYEITLENGVIEVTKKKLVYTSEGSTWTYDDVEHKHETIIKDNDNKEVDGEEIKVTNSTKITNVGSTGNVLTIKVERDGVDTTRNYDIYNPARPDAGNVLSAWGMLTINKRPITITPVAISKMYDGKPLSWNYSDYFIFNDGTDLGIVDGHIVDGSVVVEGSRTNVNKLVATDLDNTTIKSGTVKIVNDNNDDKTDNYSITLLQGTITITKRPVTVTPNKVEEEYDGNAHMWAYKDYFTFSSGENEGLVNDHIVKNVEGLVENSRIHTFDTALSHINDSLFVLLEGELAVTTNYSITYADGEIKINPRPVTITPKRVEKIYDGTSLEWKDQWTNTNGFEYTDKENVTGDWARYFTIEGSRTYVTDNDNSVLKNVVMWSDKYGIEVTRDYTITTQEGEIEILKRKLIYTSESKSFTYDDTVKSYAVLDSDSYTYLADGENIIIVDYTKETNADTYDNVITIKIEKSTIDTTINYDIHYPANQDEGENLEWGKLVINKRVLTITPNKLTKIYDGKSISWTYDDYFTFNKGTDVGIVSGHKVADTVIVSGSRTNVELLDALKDFDNTVIKESTVKIVNANNDNKTANYDFTLIEGDIEITPLDIKVKANNVSTFYDGLAHGWTNEGFSYEAAHYNSENQITYYSSYQLVNSQFVKETVVVNGSRTNVNKLEAIDDDELIIDDSTFEIYEGLIKVNSNYNIIYLTGTITIIPRPIVLTPVDVSYVYNGYEQSWDETTAKTQNDNKTILDAAKSGLNFEFGLVSGHKVTDYTVKGSRIIVGDDPTELNEGYKIYSGELNVTTNYSVELGVGTLTITKRTIKVTTKNLEFTYNGYYQNASATDFIIDSETPLALTDTLAIAESTSIRDVLQNEDNNNIVTKFEISHETISNPVTDCYDIITPADGYSEWGTIKLLKKTIEVESGSHTFTYDGEDHQWLYQFDDATSNGDPAYATYCASDVLKVVDGTKVNEINETGVDNELVYKMYRNYNTLEQEDITGNYNITPTNVGTLKVIHRYVFVTSNNQEFTYDAKVHNFNNVDSITIISKTLGEDIELRNVAMTRTYKYVWDDDDDNKIKINTSSLRIYLDGEDVTDNYKILTPDSPESEWKVITDEAEKARIKNDGLNVWGTITINQADVTFAPTSFDREYNAETQYWVYQNGITIGKVVEADGVDTRINLLADGDDIRANEITVTGSAKEVGDAGTLTIDESTVLIFDSQGRNTINGHSMNDNYNIEYLTGTITITPREIHIQPLEVKYTYDAKEHTWADKYNGSVGNTASEGVRVYNNTLITGHYVSSVTVDGSAKYYSSAATATEVDVDSVVILDADGNEVQKNYQIEGVSGKLVIEKREITLKAGDNVADAVVLEYDGTAQSYAVYTIESGSLAMINATESEEVVATYTSKVFTGENPVDNEFITLKIMNGTEDVTGNYKLTKEKGKLFISKRTISVTIENHCFSFDNYNHYFGIIYHSINIERILENHAIEIQMTSSSKYVGEHDILLEGIYVYKEVGTGYEYGYTYQGETIQYNDLYDVLVDLSSAKCTIIPQNITLTAGDAYKEFDGEELVCNDITAKYTDGIIYSNNIVIDGVCSGSITNVGEVTNSIVSYVIYEADYDGGYALDKDGNKIDITYCFDVVDEIAGKLVVDNALLKIKSETATKYFDGKSLIAKDYEILAGEKYIDLTKYDIAITQEYEYIYPLRDANSYENSFVYKGIYTIENKITASVINKETEEDISGNYTIEYVFGTLIINPAIIDVTLPELQYQYNGKKQYPDASKITWKVNDECEQKLKDTYTMMFTFNDNTYITDVKDSRIFNERDFSMTWTNNDVDSKYNYCFSYNVVDYGYLEITPIEIELTVSAVDKIYDGEIGATVSYTITDGALLNDSEMVHHIDENSIKFIYMKDKKETNPFHAGTYLVDIDTSKIEVFNQNETTAIEPDNYKFITVPAEMKISPRSLTFIPVYQDKAYNGGPQTWTLEEDNYSATGLLTNDVITEVVIANDYYFKNVNTLGDDVIIGEIKINTFIAGNLIDVSDDYDITIKPTKIYIKPAKIIVKPNDVEVTYNGSEQSWDYVRDYYTFLDEEGNLFTLYNLKADNVSGIVSGSSTNATIDPVKLTIDSSKFVIRDEDGFKVNDNFDIKFETGELVVNKRDLVITPLKSTHEYTGGAITWNTTYNGNYSKGLLCSTLAPGEVVSYASVIGWKINVKDVGDTTVTRVDINNVIITRDNVDTTINYNISSGEGEIEVTPKKLVVTSKSNSWVYDGDAHDYLEANVISGLVSGEYVSVTSGINITFVGEIFNTIEFVVLKADESDSTTNYNISTPDNDSTIKWGKLKVTVRTITLTPNTVDHVYNGKSVSWNASYGISSTFLGTSDEIQLGMIGLVTGSRTNYGKSATTIDDKKVVIMHNGTKNVNDCYTINVEKGEINVSSCQITVSTKTMIESEYYTYDTLAHSYEYFVNTGFASTIEANGDTYTSKFVKQVNAGTHENTVAITITCHDNTDGYDNNYVITYVYGTFTIKQANLKIATGMAKKVYDGTPLKQPKYSVKGLVGDDVADVICTGSQTLVDESLNECSYVIYNADGIDVTSNYNVTLALGTLKVYS